MAHLNGVGTPQAKDNTVTGKRKRAGAAEEVDRSPQSSHDHYKTHTSHNELLHQLLDDVLEVLKSCDTSPSILEHSLDTSTHDSRIAKKAKLSQLQEPMNVASMVNTKAYNTIDEFVGDMTTAMAAVTYELKGKIDSDATNGALSTNTRLQAEVAKVASFRSSLETILVREMVLRPKAFSVPDSDLQTGAEETEQKAAPAEWSHQSSSQRQVLTLFGSAPNARQLFSSFQQPTSNRGKIEAKPLSEWGLPNGIAATRTVPVHSLDDRSEKAVPTLGELMPQPASLAQLNPPRQSKHTATRSGSVGWVNATEALNPSRPFRRDSYITQSLATGQWLKYNVPTSTSQLATSETKRKQRDRALSFGEPQPPIPQETVDAHNHKKEDALFRSIYSSFAPSKDSTGATVSQRMKDQLWWSRYGESQFASIFSSPIPDDIVNGDMESDHVGASVDVGSDDGELDTLRDAVASWTPEDSLTDPSEAKKPTVEPPETTEEVDEILQEISELLETLHSYQRIRNLSLTNTARASAGNHTALSGTPTSPSSAEFDMYSILKSQLSIMVSSLPPWALARINGEKLGDLNLSRRLQVPNDIYTGTMEDDEAVLKAKPISTPAAGYPRAIPPASVPARSSYAGNAAQQYQRAGYPPQTAARSTANPSSYLPNQQYSARPASASQYLGNSRSYAPRPSASTERYNYGNSQQYNPQAQSSASGYANPNRSYANQNASYYGNQYTPSHSSAAPLQRPSQPGYQQRAADAITYNYPSGKAGSPPQTHPAYTPPQRSYAGINATPSQPRPNSYNSNVSSYGQAPPNAVNGTGSAMAAYKSANEQAAFINRQKAQMEESRQKSITPQSQPASRTATPLPNGIATAPGQ